MSLESFNTFVSVAEDCKAEAGTIPKPKKDGKQTVAEVHYRMLVEEPYQHTQEEILFQSSNLMRNTSGLTKEEKADLRAEFLSKSQACLRASPMGKSYGWGIHFDDQGRAAAYGRETAEYKELINNYLLEQTKAMRTKKA